MIPSVCEHRTVIVANGAFPQHGIPLSFLHGAQHLVCCDGAAEPLLEYGLEPGHIVGDLDSISRELRQRYRRRLHYSADQDTNDLTKAVRFCVEQGWKEITIVGATGRREDHSIGNISLLADYAACAEVQLITDYGVFTPLLQSDSFACFASQQVSIFSITPDTVFTFHGLKYPLDGKTISSWWQGTLNEALGTEFSIDMDRGRAVVFREHRRLCPSADGGMSA